MEKGFSLDSVVDVFSGYDNSISEQKEDDDFEVMEDMVMFLIL